MKIHLVHHCPCGGKAGGGIKKSRNKNNICPKYNESYIFCHCPPYLHHVWSSWHVIGTVQSHPLTWLKDQPMSYKHWLRLFHCNVLRTCSDASVALVHILQHHILYYYLISPRKAEHFVFSWSVPSVGSKACLKKYLIHRKWVIKLCGSLMCPSSESGVFFFLSLSLFSMNIFHPPTT